MANTFTPAAASKQLETLNNTLTDGSTSVILNSATPSSAQTSSLNGAASSQAGRLATTRQLSQAAKDFRAAGGRVVAWYYGEWRTDNNGRSFNPYPWSWLDKYPERQPLSSIRHSSPRIWNFNNDTQGFVFQNGVANDGVTGLTKNATSITITAAGVNAYLFTRDNLQQTGLNIDTRLYQKIEVKIKRVGGTTGWRGECTFATTTDSTYPASKRVTAAQPTWDGNFQTVTFDFSANADWLATNGQIRRVLFTFPNTTPDAFEIDSIQFIPVNEISRLMNEKDLMGLPSQEQWAMDYEISTAYGHGIDDFGICWYWDRALSANPQDYNIDLFQSSTVNVPMKYFITWANADLAAMPSTTAELDLMLANLHARFQNAKYLKYGTKPVFAVFSNGNFGDRAKTIFNMDGSTTAFAAVQTISAYIQNWFKTHVSGLYPDGIFLTTAGRVSQHPYWVGKQTVGSYGGLEDGSVQGVHEYSFSFAYANRPTTRANPSTTYPTGTFASPGVVKNYAQLHESGRDQAWWNTNVSNTGLAYWVPVMSGWDSRPWQGRFGYESFTEAWNAQPNVAEFELALQEARSFAIKAGQNTPTQGPPVVTIYAWNEYAEGGWLCPTKGRGFSFLEAVARTFGR